MAVAIGLTSDAVIAAAMTAVLVTGGFDLSVGAVLALAGVVAGGRLHAGWGVAPAVATALSLGAAIGAANGLIITKVGINPLITTLGMMGITSGATLVVSGGEQVARFPSAFRFFGQGHVAGIPTPVVIAAAVIILGDFLLRRARWLRLVYYVGSNEEAAVLAGIPVERVKVLAYVACGVAAASAGILSAAYLGAAFPMAGKGAELRVISACVIGGCSLSGGEGSIIGSLLGVVLMALIGNGLVLLNVSLYWQDIVSGAILIAAVAIDVLGRRGRR